MQHLGWFNWRLLVLFALAGPPLGVSVLVIAGISQGSSVSVPSSATEFAALGLVNLVLLGYAYLFGVVPAGLTGLLLPVAVRLTPYPLRRRLWVQVFVAALSGSLVCWLFFHALTPFDARAFAMLGGCSAAACTLIAAWWLKVREPKPVD